jgi:hypothetical protein
MRRLIGAVAAALLALAVACGGADEEATTRAASPTAASTPEMAASKLKPAHDFTMRTFEGDTFTLSDHFGELPVVLNFWAPW